MQTPGLHHVVLTVSSFDRTQAFYRDLLGFDVQRVDYEGGSVMYFTVGDVSIYFVKHAETPPEDAFSEIRLGLDHLSFKATNEAELQALADKLVAAGVNTKGMETFATGNKYMAFRDPDNIQLEYWLD
jgi:glyoxylase I family protein